ncbi:MAG: O-succinylhomoserine sulfhydrylase [Rhizobiaceae bacterium]|nr:O-succinylhomoserine sulfhydrylase [Rhizobiaceae bacterium]
MTFENDWHPETKLVHGGTSRSQFGETSEAMYLTQGFVYETAEAAEARFKGDEDGYVYSRYGNPTVSMFQERMCLLEGAEDARATASGMAAVTAAIGCQVEHGDHIVAAHALFGSCRWVVEKLMPKYGVECTLVDGKNLNAWKAAVKPNTKVFFLESPTNPTLELVDIKAVADLAHENGAKLVVDNVFATPLYQHPLKLGADIVVYSATKHIDGQGRCLGGIILADKEWINENLHDYYRHTGPSLSPFNAWTLLKGLETLSVRVDRQTDTAEKIATALNGQKKVSKMIYPGLDSHAQFDLAQRQMRRGSTLLAFELAGGKQEAFEFINKLEVVSISNNLGDAKSLITHPATTTHKNLAKDERISVGITDGLVRLSVGLEAADDLIEDIDRALG